MNFPDQFNEIFDRIIAIERGYSDDQNDPGNWAIIKGVKVFKGTKYGVAGATHPYLDIENLTLEEAKQIYFEEYWVPSGCVHFDKAMCYQVMDATINHGNFETIRIIQSAVLEQRDGIFGPKTLAAIQRFDSNDLLFLFLAARIDAMRSYATWQSHGNGWMGRIATNLRYCAADNINLNKEI